MCEKCAKEIEKIKKGDVRRIKVTIEVEGEETQVMEGDSLVINVGRRKVEEEGLRVEGNAYIDAPLNVAQMLIAQTIETYEVAEQRHSPSQFMLKKLSEALGELFVDPDKPSRPH